MPSAIKALLLLATVLGALNVAQVTGILMFSSGASLQAAILQGGIAFGGTITLVMVIVGAMKLL